MEKKEAFIVFNQTIGMVYGHLIDEKKYKLILEMSNYINENFFDS